MIPIGNPADLLKAAPITQLVRQNPATKEEILKEIKLSIIKCVQSLGIEMQPNGVETMAEDIVEVYPVESVEDITYCLRQGRQGAYNDIQTYGKFNMLIFKQWMARHLDKKYELKEEKQIQAEKKREEDEGFDKDKFYSEGLAYQEDLKAIQEAEEKKNIEYVRLKTEMAKKFVAEEKKK